MSCVALQPITLGALLHLVTAMYRSVTAGRFSRALTKADALLALIPLSEAPTLDDVDPLMQLIAIARSAFLCFLCTHSLVMK